MQRTVRLVIQDARLRQALALHLGGQFTLATDDAAGEADRGVILTTTTDTKPEQCAEMVALGNVVVILATVPRDHEEALYLAAGASRYLGMTLDTGGLDEALERASAPFATCEHGS